jgi:tRNA(Ile)-lysidine synthase
MSEDPLLQRFSDDLDRNQLIPIGSKVLVGYSGGADSTCLLHMLHQLGKDVCAGHLHHGMRKEADDEMAKCEDFARQIDIPLLTGKTDIPALAASMKVGIEEAGRHARYEFFERAADALGCDLIATAHTKTDQAETVLLNMVRGSGLSGLAGIPQKRGRIVRPLLQFSREEARAYCERHGLWFHDDPANEDIGNARTRVRLNVLPELRSINSAAVENIARMASRVRAEDELLDSMAAAALERAELRPNGDLHFLTQDAEAYFATESLASVPMPLLRRCVRLLARVFGAQLEFDEIDRIAAEVHVRSGSGSITAPGGDVVFEWSPERLAVRSLAENEAFRFPLTVPGETYADEFGWKLVAYPVEAAPASWPRSGYTTFLDPGALKGNLYFRSLQPGDRIQPLGFEGSRKVADILSEQGATQSLRQRLPIICDMLGPVWVPGCCASERCKPQPGTKSSIKLSFERI